MEFGPGTSDWFFRANANADEKKDTGARYDVRYEWGDGAHSDVHGGWLLPGILRWMFGK